MRGTAVPGPRCRCPPLLLLHQGAEAGLGDEAPHRVQLQWAVTSQPWCGPASPPPPVEADIGVDSEGGSGLVPPHTTPGPAGDTPRWRLTRDGRVQEEAAVAAGSVETLTPDLGLVT